MLIAFFTSSNTHQVAARGINFFPKFYDAANALKWDGAQIASTLFPMSSQKRSS